MDDYVHLGGGASRRHPLYHIRKFSRPKAIPADNDNGQRTIRTPVYECLCQSRRGFAGGCCGNCGGAIPTPIENAKVV